MAEQLFRKQQVVGSNPTTGSKYFVHNKFLVLNRVARLPERRLLAVLWLCLAVTGGIIPEGYPFSRPSFVSAPASFDAFASREAGIAVVGLGYVGLPLAVVLASRFRVTGLDINPVRIEELKRGVDRTRELTPEALKRHPIEFTTNPAVLSEARLILVTVPTPIDAHRLPDLGPLEGASRMIGRHLKPGTTVVYESTVYPGCTEEDCLPLIEAGSGLRWGEDFFVGYSPERINPGTPSTPWTRSARSWPATARRRRTSLPAFTAR